MKTMFFFFLFFFFLFYFMLSKAFHLLNFLIGLEMFVVCFLMVMTMNKVFYLFFFIPLLFLSFSVCESILGLVLFVWFIRFYSKDYMSMISILKL